MMNFRNNLIMLAKNLPISELVWKMPIRLGLDAISAYKGILSGDLTFFMAIAKAHFSFFGYLMSGKIKRSINTKPMKSLQGVYGGSLVWQYFIKVFYCHNICFFYEILYHFVSFVAVIFCSAWKLQIPTLSKGMDTPLFDT